MEFSWTDRWEVLGAAFTSRSSLEERRGGEGREGSGVREGAAATLRGSAGDGFGDRERERRKHKPGNRGQWKEKAGIKRESPKGSLTRGIHVARITPALLFWFEVQYQTVAPAQ